MAVWKHLETRLCMDFFPDLGEPGLIDELFYFGPLITQLVLAVWFYRMTGRWLKKEQWGIRLVATVGMVFVADVLLLISFGVIFRLANPGL